MEKGFHKKSKEPILEPYKNRIEKLASLQAELDRLQAEAEAAGVRVLCLPCRVAPDRLEILDLPENRLV